MLLSILIVEKPKCISIRKKIQHIYYYIVYKRRRTTTDDQQKVGGMVAGTKRCSWRRIRKRRQEIKTSQQEAMDQGIGKHFLSRPREFLALQVIENSFNNP